MDLNRLIPVGAPKEGMDRCRERGLRALKQYLDKNSDSDVAVKVDAAIKKLMEEDQPRRETAREGGVVM